MKSSRYYTDDKGRRRPLLATGMYSAYKFRCDKCGFRRAGITYTTEYARQRGPCLECDGYGDWTKYLTPVKEQR